jgi:hypothetical protein
MFKHKLVNLVNKLTWNKTKIGKLRMWVVQEADCEGKIKNLASKIKICIGKLFHKLGVQGHWKACHVVLGAIKWLTSNKLSRNL